MRIHPVFRISLIAAVLLAIPSATMAMPAALPAGVIITVGFAPPPLPVYVQPVCPGEGYIWVPGYWAYGDDDYYWVPGTWVVAPEVGFLWTPGYWGWSEGLYVFHEGYWGPHVGFYGGINYGFGYFGVGFEGGHWDHDRFFYNRAVSNVNVTVVHNVYETRVNERVESRVSFNGGDGGINARPRPEEERAARDHHIAAVENQTRHEQAAREDRGLRASVNQGKPPIAATPRPGAFQDRATVPANEAGGPYHAQPSRPAAEVNRPATESRPEPSRAPAIHPRELTPPPRSTAPNTGNAKLDQKYQQQQEKLNAQQERDRQKLQQRQDQEHQRAEQQKSNDAARRQIEQNHQQQTQQLAQKHADQQQHLQQRQSPPPAEKPHKPERP